MPNIAGKDFDPKEIKDLIVSPTASESEGWLSEYVEDLWDYVPDLSTSSSKVNDLFSEIGAYIPTGKEVWNYGRSWIVSDESAKQFQIIIKAPEWALENATEFSKAIGSTYKTISGAGGAYYSLDKVVKAFKRKDPICFTLSCAAVCLDLAKLGSSVFPYHHNCIRNDAINAGLKLTTAACEKWKVCNKIKKLWGVIKERL